MQMDIDIKTMKNEIFTMSDKQSEYEHSRNIIFRQTESLIYLNVTLTKLLLTRFSQGETWLLDWGCWLVDVKH